MLDKTLKQQHLATYLISFVGPIDSYYKEHWYNKFHQNK